MNATPSAGKLRFFNRFFSAVSVAAGLLLAGEGALSGNPVNAQAAAASPAQDIAGTWQGTLHAGKDLRIVIKITKADSGYKADFYSIDQSGAPLQATSITLQGTAVKMSLSAIGGKYEGKLASDGKTIAGDWTQGSNPLPLPLERATPATEWSIPEPPPVIPPMAADANPSFEVATIKPSKPDAQGFGIIVRGRRIETMNTTLTDLMKFAYRVHGKQIIGMPDWADTAKYDITGQPDAEGQPSDAQWRSMLAKMLAERFHLAFHHDKKELSVYVLSVAKDGPKLTKSEGDPNGLPGLGFQGLGKLVVRNANMGDFTSMILQAVVLDRPVLDQTGLAGRYNFTLNWTPDDSQFGGRAANLPPPADTTNPPPALYTAIQEQIGLKLEATKAPADVLVVDKVETPSEN